MQAYHICPGKTGSLVHERNTLHFIPFRVFMAGYYLHTKSKRNAGHCLPYLPQPYYTQHLAMQLMQRRFPVAEITAAAPVAGAHTGCMQSYMVIELQDQGKG